MNGIIERRQDSVSINNMDPPIWTIFLKQIQSEIGVTSNYLRKTLMFKATVSDIVCVSAVNREVISPEHNNNDKIGG